MTTWVLLLRGINLAGRNRVPMAQLRRILVELGHEQVRTHLQSGNAVVSSDRGDPEAIGAELTDRLDRDLGVPATVMVRSADELDAVAAANPYPDAAAADPTRVHVGFLSGVPADPSVFAFDPDEYAPEELTLGDRVVYLHLPNGMGRSPLAVALGRRRTDLEVTLRNWRTVTRLRELTRG